MKDFETLIDLVASKEVDIEGMVSDVYAVETAEKAFKRGTKWIYEADTIRQLKKAEKRAVEEIRKTEIDKNRDILYVDITGEIYLVCDYFSNQNILKELGKMGVQTRRSLTVSGFLRDAIIPKWMKKKNLETHLERAPKLAKPWLKRDIGGDALEVISDVHFANRQHKDGIIHISPFTCMPEIMSHNILHISQYIHYLHHINKGNLDI